VIGVAARRERDTPTSGIHRHAQQRTLYVPHQLWRRGPDDVRVDLAEQPAKETNLCLGVHGRDGSSAGWQLSRGL